MIPSARAATLAISAVGSHFKAGTTTVTFNDVNVVATKVDVGSATNLRVQVALTAQALMGPHDVTVVTPGALTGGAEERLVLQGGLTVQPTLFPDLQSGMTTAATAPQGGLTQVLVRNLDYRSNPFDLDTTRPISGVALPLGLLTPPMVTINATTFGTLAIVDALAPVGGLSVGLASTNPLGQTVQFASDPADTRATQVTARLPVVLNAAAGVTNQKIATPNSTVLYKYTSPADNYVATLSLSTIGTGLLGGVSAAPRVLGYQAPTTGRFAEGFPLDTSATVSMPSMTLVGRNVAVYLPKAGDNYFVLYPDNLTGSDNHTYTLTLNAGAGTAVSLVEPVTPDTTTSPLTAVTLDKHYYATDGQIDVAGESDYIRVLPGKSGPIYASVSTNTGAMIGIGLYAMNCTTPINTSGLRIAQGASSQEEMVTAGNQYCVRISGPVKTSYQLVLTQDNLP